MEVTFRRLVEEDLPQLHRWLNEPGVVRWWEGDDVSWEAVVRDHWTDPDAYVEHWIALVDGREVGWIQCYAAADAAEDPDEPEEAQAWLALGVDTTAAGIDYLVGDPVDRGRGVGSAVIRAFVDQVVFGLHPGWTQVCASPYVANEASWRALGRAGFSHRADVDGGDGPCRLMVRDREPPAT
ncbi:GNAT family N-acetyltransferase [Iamia majanohamensis]|uniref:GNAT family N-acetyltransferase n=1 Tax=Iamia majanohamensis TaxID=467976 RepID=A0AAE9Y3Y4_9ACTN|nr:GNAT family N-acetyltransferase [Iamia majanohamensis]WCO65689.1 GNAT family N-acetyltransferase [Iamia majanohamensis]